jgi:hypothetical protein
MTIKIGRATGLNRLFRNFHFGVQNYEATRAKRISKISFGQIEDGEFYLGAFRFGRLGGSSVRPKEGGAVNPGEEERLPPLFF